MTDVLIGHTGFVGSNLANARQFPIKVASRSIGTIANGQFSHVFCAGVQAKKWIANKEPEKDREGIQRLMDVLDTIECERFVHISTIDVFSDTTGVTEDSVPNPSLDNAYGRNRLELEEFVRTRFKNAHILRLPALFGPNLQKNIIYDLLNNNMVENINPASSFQWYPVSHLANDIDKVIEADLPLVHFAVEPVQTQKILESFFPGIEVGQQAGTQASYDFHTKYASRFGTSGPYMLSSDNMMTSLNEYIRGELGES